MGHGVGRACRRRCRRCLPGGAAGPVGPDQPVVSHRARQRIQRLGHGARVVHFGQGAALGRPHRQVLGADAICDRIRRVVVIDHGDSPCRADRHARGLEPDFQLVLAEIALVRGAGFRRDVQRVVGARVHAALAADAAGIVKIHHAVGCSEQRTSRADRDAGRVVAVVAAHHCEVPLRLRELAGLDVVDPRPVDAERHVVLALAGHRACVATDARAAVQQEPQARHGQQDRTRPGAFCPFTTAICFDPSGRLRTDYRPVLAARLTWHGIGKGGT